MTDHDSPEAVAQRASQEDPIVMYLIVHESLGMSTGKTAAQCGHAAEMLAIKYSDLKDESRRLQKIIAKGAPPTEVERARASYAAIAPFLSIYGEYRSNSFRKVTLRASDKEWEKLKEEFKGSMVMVVDAGLTEIAAGSETVIGLWPMRKSQRPKSVTRLQVLK